MKGLFKLIFGIVGAVVITALIFVVTLVIGHSVTGSWDMREWNKEESATVVSVAEYSPELQTNALAVTLE